MFGVSFTELITILAIVLIVFGPERLPEISRQLGRWLGELRKHSDSLRREFYNAVYTPAIDLQRNIEGEAKKLTTQPVSAPDLTSTSEGSEKKISENKDKYLDNQDDPS